MFCPSQPATSTSPLPPAPMAPIFNRLFAPSTERLETNGKLIGAAVVATALRFKNRRREMCWVVMCSLFDDAIKDLFFQSPSVVDSIGARLSTVCAIQL